MSSAFMGISIYSKKNFSFSLPRAFSSSMFSTARFIIVQPSGRYEAVGKVVAALDRALKQGAAVLAQEAGHIIGRHFMEPVRGARRRVENAPGRFSSGSGVFSQT